MIQETVANNHNTQNSRIYERNIPSQPLQPYLDVRAVSTKYSFLPIVDPRKENKVNLLQLFALQKCSQSTYVPDSKSDLYQYSFNPTQVQQTHSLLFQKENFDAFNPNPDNKIVGFGSFNNSTRCQIKDLSD